MNPPSLPLANDPPPVNDLVDGSGALTVITGSWQKEAQGIWFLSLLNFLDVLSFKCWGLPNTEGLIDDGWNPVIRISNHTPNYFKITEMFQRGNVALISPPVSQQLIFAPKNPGLFNALKWHPHILWSQTPNKFSKAIVLIAHWSHLLQAPRHVRDGSICPSLFKAVPA